MFFGKITLELYIIHNCDANIAFIFTFLFTAMERREFAMEPRGLWWHQKDQSPFHWHLAPRFVSLQQVCYQVIFALCLSFFFFCMSTFFHYSQLKGDWKNPDPIITIDTSACDILEPTFLLQLRSLWKLKFHRDEHDLSATSDAVYTHQPALVLQHTCPQALMSFCINVQVNVVLMWAVLVHTRSADGDFAIVHKSKVLLDHTGVITWNLPQMHL